MLPTRRLEGLSVRQILRLHSHNACRLPRPDLSAKRPLDCKDLQSLLPCQRVCRERGNPDTVNGVRMAAVTCHSLRDQLERIACFVCWCFGTRPVAVVVTVAFTSASALEQLGALQDDNFSRSIPCFLTSEEQVARQSFSHSYNTPRG